MRERSKNPGNQIHGYRNFLAEVVAYRMYRKSNMADRSGERWRWLCGRGRRPNVYTVITTLFLVMVAVQRREYTVDRLRPGTDDQRQRYTANQQTDMSSDPEHAEQQIPVIGVFLLINVDNIDDHQWNHTFDGTLPQVDAQPSTRHFPSLPGFVWAPWEEESHGSTKIW